MVEDFDEIGAGQTLEDGEVIHPEWVSIDEVRAMCLDGRIQEERSVAVLLRFIEGAL